MMARPCCVPPSPPPSEPSLIGVPSEGATLQYQVRPLQPGLRNTNILATLDYVDYAGFSDRREFPVPEVRVLGRLFLPWLARAQCRPRRVDVALVFDTSRSMEQPAGVGQERKLDEAREAARGFLETMRFPGDRAAIVSFDERARVLEALTEDPGLALAGLDALRTAPGTRIDLGLRAGTSALRDAERESAVAPVLVLLTDGRPTPGTRDAALEAASEARSTDVIVFSCGTM